MCMNEITATPSMPPVTTLLTHAWARFTQKNKPLFLMQVVQILLAFAFFVTALTLTRFS